MRARVKLARSVTLQRTIPRGADRGLYVYQHIGDPGQFAFEGGPYRCGDVVRFSDGEPGIDADVQVDVVLQSSFPRKPFLDVHDTRDCECRSLKRVGVSALIARPGGIGRTRPGYYAPAR